MSDKVYKDNDPINPEHYRTGKIEVIQLIEGIFGKLPFYVGFCLGNTIKYVCRYDKKNSTKQKQIEDLEKALWYLERVIKNCPDSYSSPMTSNQSWELNVNINFVDIFLQDYSTDINLIITTLLINSCINRETLAIPKRHINNLITKLKEQAGTYE